MVQIMNFTYVMVPVFQKSLIKKKTICEKCTNHIEYVRHVTFFWQIFVIVWKNQNSDDLFLINYNTVIKMGTK